MITTAADSMVRCSWSWRIVITNLTYSFQADSAAMAVMISIAMTASLPPEKNASWPPSVETVTQMRRDSYRSPAADQ
jgi:hypothetical protein